MAGTSLIFAQIHACQIICSGPSAERPFYCKYYSKRKIRLFVGQKLQHQVTQEINTKKHPTHFLRTLRH